MIHYKIKNPNFFAKTIIFISELTDEGFIEFGGKLRISGMDGGRLSMFELFIDEDELEILEDEKIEVGISFSSLGKIMKRMPSSDSLSIKFDTARNKFSVRGEINNKTKTFSIPELDLDYSDTSEFIQRLLEIKMNVTFSMDVSELKDIVSDMEMVNDNITMDALSDSIKFYTNGYGSEVCVEVPTGENYIEEKSSYPIHFLKKYVRGFTGMRALIRYKKDNPLEIFNKLTEKSKFVFFVAPRVDVDE